MRNLLIMVLAIFSLGEAVANPDAQRLIQDQTDTLLERIQVNGAIRSDVAALETVIVDTIGQHVDFSLFSKLVLGKYRKRLSPDEQVRFQEALTGVVVRTYAASIASVAGLSIDYLGTQPGKKQRVTVLTAVESAGNPKVSINYRLYRKEGRWRVYDVVIEGVSMVSNYRSVVAEKIRADGIEAVIDSFAGPQSHLAARTAEAAG